MVRRIDLYAAALVSTLVAACGPAQPAADSGHAAEHGDHGKEHGGHHDGKGHGAKEHGGHHDLGGALGAFHDVLAPVYHMEKGAARDEKTCASVGAMRDTGAKVAAEPAGDAAAWTPAAETLSKRIDELDTACKAAGHPDAPAKLESLHDAFHALMDLARKK
jgi:hypothetical protein